MVPFLSFTAARAEVVGYTEHHLFSESIGILTRAPETYRSPGIFLRPFTPFTWLLILTFIPIISLILHFVTKIASEFREEEERDARISNHMMDEDSDHETLGDDHHRHQHTIHHEEEDAHHDVPSRNNVGVSSHHHELKSEERANDPEEDEDDKRSSPPHFLQEKKAENDVIPKFSDSLLFICGSCVSQGGTGVANLTPVRILISSWWLMLIVLVSTYTGNLIGFLAFPELMWPISSLSDLLVPGVPPVIIMIIQGSSFHQQLMVCIPD